jgi:threonine aldolase
VATEVSAVALGRESAGSAPCVSRRHFASDNTAGICPEAWQALQEANHGSAAAYGDDPWTARASDLLRELFEIDCEVFFTFGGTAANSLGLAALCQSYHSVIAHEFAHVETDECGGPEFYSNGTKLLLAGGANGKVDPGAVEAIVRRRSDIHFPKPRALSITQATEMGTVYSLADLDAVRETACRLDLHLHMDGARFANAVATLGASPKEVTWKMGVDVLCFGGTKNGMAVGDCVIFFDRQLAYEFGYRCKQAGQLASKMRFLSAPWIGLLTGGVWLENARRANRAAQRLAAGLRGIPGVEILFPVEANSVFVRLAPAVAEGLRAAGWVFYNFIGAGGLRLMCNWSTTEAEVDELLDDVRRLSPAPAN